MIHEGYEIKPAASHCFVRVLDDAVTDAGIVKIGDHAVRLVVVESAPYWVTSQGAKIEVDLHPGDEITLRAKRKIGQSSVGQPVYDIPVAQSDERWPRDVRMIALADIVASARKVEDTGER